MQRNYLETATAVPPVREGFIPEKNGNALVWHKVNKDLISDKVEVHAGLYETVCGKRFGANLVETAVEGEGHSNCPTCSQ